VKKAKRKTQTVVPIDDGDNSREKSEYRTMVVLLIL
jgi:hypothetical protein